MTIRNIKDQREISKLCTLILQRSSGNGKPVVVEREVHNPFIVAYNLSSLLFLLLNTLKKYENTWVGSVGTSRWLLKRSAVQLFLPDYQNIYHTTLRQTNPVNTPGSPVKSEIQDPGALTELLWLDNLKNSMSGGLQLHNLHLSSMEGFSQDI